MDENRKKLYDQLSANYDMGTFDEFDSDLDNEDNQKVAWEAMGGQDGYGDFGLFQQAIARSPQVEETQQAEPAAAQPITTQPIATQPDAAPLMDAQQPDWTTTASAMPGEEDADADISLPDAPNPGTPKDASAVNDGTTENKPTVTEDKEQSDNATSQAEDYSTKSVEELYAGLGLENKEYSDEELQNELRRSAERIGWISDPVVFEQRKAEFNNSLNELQRRMLVQRSAAQVEQMKPPLAHQEVMPGLDATTAQEIADARNKRFDYLLHGESGKQGSPYTRAVSTQSGWVRSNQLIEQARHKDKSELDEITDKALNAMSSDPSQRFGSDEEAAIQLAAAMAEEQAQANGGHAKTPSERELEAYYAGPEGTYVEVDGQHDPHEEQLVRQKDAAFRAEVKRHQEGYTHGLRGYATDIEKDPLASADCPVYAIPRMVKGSVENELREKAKERSYKGYQPGLSQMLAFSDDLEANEYDRHLKNAIRIFGPERYEGYVLAWAKKYYTTIANARVAVDNMIRNEIINQLGLKPSNNWEYLFGSVLNNTFVTQGLKALYGLEKGTRPDDFNYITAQQAAYRQYEDEHNNDWKDKLTQMAAPALTLVADAVTGGFFLAGKASLLTSLLPRLFYASGEAASRSLMNSAIYRIFMGSLSGAANFATYEMQSMALQQLATGEYREKHNFWSSLGHAGVSGAAKGMVFGTVGEAFGSLFSGVSGKMVYGVEAGKLLAETATFSAMGYLENGNLTFKDVGTNFGLALSGRVSHAGKLIKDIRSRANNDGIYGRKANYHKISEAEKDALVALGYGDVASALRGENISEPMLRRMQNQLEQMRLDKRVSWETIRCCDWVLNGRLNAVPGVRDKIIEADGKGGYTITAVDANGRAIMGSVHVTGTEARNKVLSSINHEIDKAGWVENESKMQSSLIGRQLVETVREYAESTGEDAEALLKTYMTALGKDFDHKSLESVEKKVYETINALRSGKGQPTDIADTKETIGKRFGVDIDQAIKTEKSQRTKEQRAALAEYQEWLDSREDIIDLHQYRGPAIERPYYGPERGRFERKRELGDDEYTTEVEKWRGGVMLGKVVVVNSLDEVTDAKVRKQIADGDAAGNKSVPGWYDSKTDTAYIYAPHIIDGKDFNETMLHEVVSHKGLRGLLGEADYNKLLDKIWEDMSPSERKALEDYPGGEENESEVERTRRLADEWLAHRAQGVDVDGRNSIWQTAKRHVKDWLRRHGIDVYYSDYELENMLRESYRELAGKGRKTKAERGREGEPRKEGPIIEGEPEHIHEDKPDDGAVPPDDGGTTPPEGVAAPPAADGGETPPPVVEPPVERPTAAVGRVEGTPAHIYDWEQLITKVDAASLPVEKVQEGLELLEAEREQAHRYANGELAEEPSNWEYWAARDGLSEPTRQAEPVATEPPAGGIEQPAGKRDKPHITKDTDPYGVEHYGYDDSAYDKAFELEKEHAAELDKLEGLNDEEYESAADEIMRKLPHGFDVFYDKETGVSHIEPAEPTRYGVGNLHETNRKFKIGEHIQLNFNGRYPHAIVTRINENGKVAEAIDAEDGRTLIRDGKFLSTDEVLAQKKLPKGANAEAETMEPSELPMTEHIAKMTDAWGDVTRVEVVGQNDNGTTRVRLWFKNRDQRGVEADVDLRGPQPPETPTPPTEPTGDATTADAATDVTTERPAEVTGSADDRQMNDVLSAKLGEVDEDAERRAAQEADPYYMPMENKGGGRMSPNYRKATAEQIFNHLNDRENASGRGTLDGNIADGVKRAEDKVKDVERREPKGKGRSDKSLTKWEKELTDARAQLEKWREVERMRREQKAAEGDDSDPTWKQAYDEFNSSDEEPVNLEDYVARHLYGTKFKWKDKEFVRLGGRTHGLGGHLGLSKSDKERRAFFGWIDEKNGSYPESVAEGLYANMPDWMRERYDTMEILDAVLNVVGSNPRPRDMVVDYVKRLREQNRDMDEHYADEAAGARGFHDAGEMDAYDNMREREAAGFHDVAAAGREADSARADLLADAQARLNDPNASEFEKQAARTVLRYRQREGRDRVTAQGTEGDGVRFRVRDDERRPTFYSNAERAVENVKQGKATAEQWKAMLTKAGGIKAGEDKWMGLTDWLDERKGQSLTKDEVLQFVRDNGIRMEEVNYGGDVYSNPRMQELQAEYRSIYDNLKAQRSAAYDEAAAFNNKMVEKYGTEAWHSLLDEGDKAQHQQMVDDFERKFGAGLDDAAMREMIHRYGDDFASGFDGVIGNLRVGYGFDGIPVDAAKYYLGDINSIESTRELYTTRGLENKREIAFVVPGIEPYQENDAVHFGPENEGRAVMWVRFGETTDTDGNRVLVIDEIQSNRHQDAREKGYREPAIKQRLDKAQKEYSDYGDMLVKKYNVPKKYVWYSANAEERQKIRELRNALTHAEREYRDNYGIHSDLIPAAPFEKNWHEVAMKRMLRLAADEGFDKVAWTTGEQQAERYNLEAVVESIDVDRGQDDLFLTMQDGTMYDMGLKPDGTLRSTNELFSGKHVNDVFGKEMGERILSVEGQKKFSGEGLHIGGEGMKGFYDEILPRFMNKYGKKWGSKVGDVKLSTPGGEVMHSIDVTEPMKESVMQGQPLFRIRGEHETGDRVRVRREGMSDGRVRVEGLPGEWRNIDEAGRAMQLSDPEHMYVPSDDGKWLDVYDWRDNEVWDIWRGKPGSKRYEKWRERTLNHIHKQVPEYAKKLGLDVELIDNEADVPAGHEREKSWYDTETGKVHIVVPRHAAFDVSDVMSSLWHEGVSRHGLRKLVGGDNYDTFLDNVYATSDANIRTEIDRLAEDVTDGDRRGATEEYLSRLAEQMGFQYYKDGSVPVSSWMQRGLKAMRENFDKLCRHIGMADMTATLRDDDLRAVLYNSYHHLLAENRDAYAAAKRAEREDKEYVKAVKRGDIDTAMTMLHRKLAASEGIVGYAAAHGHGGNHREVSHRLKDSESGAIEQAARDMAQYVPKDAVLVPMPPHEGVVRKDTDTWLLAQELSRLTGAPVVAALRGRERESRYAAKQAGRKGLSADELGFYQDMELPDGKTPVFVDNVVGSGETAKAAVQAMGGKGMTLAYTKGSLGKPTEGLKNVTVTYDDAGNLIPLSERFDRSNSDVRFRVRDGRHGSDGIEEPRGEHEAAVEDARRRLESDDASEFERTAARTVIKAYGGSDDAPDTPGGGVRFRTRDDADMLVDMAKHNNEVARQRRDAVTDFVKAITDVDELTDSKFATALGKVMRGQRTYDQETVADITTMVKAMMDAGLLTELDNFSVKQILTKVKDSTGKNDITAEANKLIDIMLKHQLRRGKRAFEQQLKVKGMRQDSRGVVVQGGLDYHGQRAAKALKEGLSLGDLQAVNDRIDEAEQRLSDPDEVVRGNAADELEGLYIARQYYDEIKQSEIDEANIKSQLEQAQADHKNGTLSDEAYKQLRQASNDALRELRCERVDAWARLNEQLSGSQSESAARAKQFREQQKQRQAEIQHWANSDMEGHSADPHEQETRKKSAGDKARDVAQALLQPLGTFDKLMRYFGNSHPKGEGYLFGFVRRFMNVRDQWFKDRKADFDQMDAAARRIGKAHGARVKVKVAGGKIATRSIKDWADVYTYINQQKPLTVSVKGKDYEITQGNATYLLAMEGQADGRMKLRSMGLTEADMDALRRQVNPMLLELSDWVVHGLLPGMRPRLNQTHIRMFGADMTDIPNYFPIRTSELARNETVNLAQQNGKIRPATITGSIIERKRNNLDLDLGADFFQVTAEHIDEMNHWNSFAEFARDLNTLLSYKRFKAQVHNLHSWRYGNGADIWKTLEDTAAITTGDYQPKTSKADTIINGATKGLAAANITFRPYTGLKQLLSAPVYLVQARWDDIGYAIANLKGTWQWAIENLPTFAERWQGRMAGDPILTQAEQERGSQNKKLRWLSKAGFAFNAGVDAVTVAIGARAIYRTKYRRYKDMGYSDEQANQKALEDASISVNETQQSGLGAFTSVIQQDRTFWSRALTIYRNASMGYQRQLVEGLKAMRNGVSAEWRATAKEKVAKKLERDGIDSAMAAKVADRLVNREAMRGVALAAMFGSIAPFVWALGAQYLGYKMAGGDDDEQERKMLGQASTHLLSGWMEGIVFGGQLSSAADFAYDYYHGRKKLRDYSLQRDLVSDMAEQILGKSSGKPADAVYDIVNMIVAMSTGVNPKSIVEPTVGIIDVVQNWGGDAKLAHEVALGWCRLLNVPQTSLDQVYIDEIGLSAKDAKQLSAEEFAERWCRYKRRRGAGWMSPLTSAESDVEQEGKLLKRYERMMDERFESLSDERVEQIMRESDDELLKKHAAKAYKSRIDALTDDEVQAAIVPLSDNAPQDSVDVKREGIKRAYKSEGLSYSKPDDDAKNALAYERRVDFFDIDEDKVLKGRRDALKKSVGEKFEKMGVKYKKGSAGWDWYAEDDANASIDEIKAYYQSHKAELDEYGILSWWFDKNAKGSSGYIKKGFTDGKHDPDEVMKEYRETRKEVLARTKQR